MAIISAQVLAMIKNAAVTTMTDSCTIERAITTLDSYGAPSQTWETSAAGVPCRLIQPGQGNTAQTGTGGDREDIKRSYKLIVGVGVTIEIDYRVTVGSVVYDVIKIETSLTEEAFHSVLMARRA
jgi:hypothetical protein